MKLAKNLRRLIKKQNITIKELSQKTGVPKSTIHNSMQGVNRRDYNQLLKLSDYFKVTIDKILTSRF